MREGISIIICFYNSGNRLIETLGHIKNQIDRNGHNTELILVNNCSTDNSIEIIQKELSNLRLFPWKIVYEGKAGLSNARLCGVNHASYEIILFCDDDNWLNPSYLNSVEQIMKINPEIAILGGKGEAISEIPLPLWFNSVQNHYAVGPQADENGKVKGKRNMVYGAGMAIRKSVFQELIQNGFRFLSLGRTGSNLSAGEDSEICLAVQIMGKIIWYDSTLSFQHFMESKRLTKTYLNKMILGKITSSFYSRFYRDFLFGYTPNVTKYFWLKELTYALKDYFLLLLRFKSLTRQYLFIRFLISERKNYSEQVQQILKTCHNLNRISK